MIDPSEYLKEFPAAFESQRANFDTNAIARAYTAADFIGISNYASMRPDFQIKELESATFQFAMEASHFGIDVKDLIFNKVWPACLESPGVGISHCSIDVKDLISSKVWPACLELLISGRFLKVSGRSFYFWASL